MKKSLETFDGPKILRIKSIVAIAVAYVLGSLAIDTGSWWQYLGCIVFLVFGVNFAVRSFTGYGKKR